MYIWFYNVAVRLEIEIKLQSPRLYGTPTGDQCCKEDMEYLQIG
jgi:hypothetical protein